VIYEQLLNTPVKLNTEFTACAQPRKENELRQGKKFRYLQYACWVINEAENLTDQLLMSSIGGINVDFFTSRLRLKFKMFAITCSDGSVKEIKGIFSSFIVRSTVKSGL
jgi:hypothetical protein